MTFDSSLDKCRRKDLYTSITVDAACSMLDVQEAAEHLAACHVPFGVAHRVLLHPNRRRGYAGAEYRDAPVVAWVNKRVQNYIEWNSAFNLPNSTQLIVKPGEQ